MKSYLQSSLTISSNPTSGMDKKDARTKRGFTRLDLLASVTAMTVLVLLLPSMVANPRIGSETAVCVNNLGRLTQAWHMHAADHRGYLPANEDISSVGQWIAGTMSNSSGATNTLNLTDPAYAQLGTYIADPAVFRCPADESTVTIDGVKHPRVRSIAMNGAVGTLRNGISPVNGPWLDNAHSHRSGTAWHTYARLGDIVEPAPSELFVLIDEDPYSINDGSFAVGMEEPEWIDWPASWHSLACGISFADGSVRIHRWHDPRTLVVNGNVSRRSVPGSPDHEWLRQRTSAPIRTP